MTVQMAIRRLQLLPASVGQCTFLLLLLLQRSVAGESFFGVPESHSEEDGVFRFAFEDTVVPVLDGFPTDPVPANDSFFTTAFSASSTATVLQPKMESVSHNGKLVGWFLSTWAGRLSEQGDSPEKRTPENLEQGGVERQLSTNSLHR